MRFPFPYEAAVWSVLAQRLHIVQAARLRAELIARHGEDGAFPPPYTLVRLTRLDLDLPGRKGEYLRAVAEAALEGLLDGVALRARPHDAVQRVQQVKGLGPFAAELVVVRGANAPDVLPITSAGWTPRSPSSTAPAAPSPKSRRRGGPTAPGPPSTCARCASSAPARSPAAEPSGSARRA